MDTAPEAMRNRTPLACRDVSESAGSLTKSRIPQKEVWTLNTDRCRNGLLVPFLASAILIGIFLLGDARSFVSSQNDEVLGHAGASAGLTLAASGTFLVLRRRAATAVLVMMLGIAATVILELAQFLAPGRGVQLQDVFAGFAGVLLATLGIEVLRTRLSVEQLSQLLALVSAVGSVVMVVMLLAVPTPRNIVTARPDGNTCPVTQISGGGNRLDLGPGLMAVDGCIRTRLGGLALIGETDTFDEASVLTTSTLPELGRTISGTRELHVRTQITTGSEVGGTVFMLWQNQSGQILQLRTPGGSLETLGPNTIDSVRSSALSAGLFPNTTYQIDILLTETTLSSQIDGVEVARTTVDPSWVDTIDSDELQLLIGNIGNRKLPFVGTIDWIEVRSGSG